MDSEQEWLESVKEWLESEQEWLDIDRRGFTLSPTALLPPSYPTALGLIGPSKKAIG